MRRANLGRAGRLAAGLVATAGIGIGTVGALAGVAGAATGTLANVKASVSNDTTGATGVTYSVNFTTATAATLTSVTVSGFGDASAASASVAECYGVDCTGATASVTAGTLTVDLTAGGAVAAGVPVLIEVGGVTNQSTAGTDTLTVTTNASGGPVDTGSTSLAFGQSTTAVTIAVPEALQFTNGTPDIYVTPIPDGGAAYAACGTGTPGASGSPISGDTATPGGAAPCPVRLTIKTNADKGYSLSATITPLTNIAHPAVTLPNNDFFITNMSASANPSATYGSSVYDGTPMFTDPQPTVGDSVSIQNAAQVTFAEAAGTYTGTITYAVTPSY